jgi:hypothetical protein
MRIRNFVAFIAIAIVLNGSVPLTAVQSNAAQSNSPQDKSTPSATMPSDDPSTKLGILVGKWQTQGAFTGGDKVSTTLECRWSPQGSFLVCDQLIKMGPAEHRQFTVYSYGSKDGYSYATLSDPGAKPTSGGVTIKGNLWTYDSSFAAKGKTRQIRTTNEFTDRKTEIFKVASSDDGGAHWKTVLEGTAHKIAD